MTNNTQLRHLPPINFMENIKPNQQTSNLQFKKEEKKLRHLPPINFMKDIKPNQPTSKLQSKNEEKKLRHLPPINFMKDIKPNQPTSKLQSKNEEKKLRISTESPMSPHNTYGIPSVPRGKCSTPNTTQKKQVITFDGNLECNKELPTFHLDLSKVVNKNITKNLPTFHPGSPNHTRVNSNSTDDSMTNIKPKKHVSIDETKNTIHYFENPIKQDISIDEENNIAQLIESTNKLNQLIESANNYNNTSIFPFDLSNASTKTTHTRANSNSTTDTKPKKYVSLDEKNNLDQFIKSADKYLEHLKTQP
ncbi:MAG: hypothetical protein ACO3K7_04160 [Candidatus Marinamargulisbacteria bacterium]